MITSDREGKSVTSLATSPAGAAGTLSERMVKFKFQPRMPHLPGLCRPAGVPAARHRLVGLDPYLGPVMEFVFNKDWFTD